MKREFQLVTITATTPYERGVQYGEQAREKIRQCITHYKNRFLNSTGQSWEVIQNFAMQFVPYIEEQLPAAMEEARGIAAGSGSTLEEIMVVNNRYEISKFPRLPECTTAVVLPEASKDGKTYVVKNWDYSDEIVGHIVLLHIKSEGYQGFGLTEAGQMVREGFNSHGVAFVNNDLQSVLDTPSVSLPVTFIRKRLWECESYEEAREFLMNTKRSVSGNTILAHASGVAEDFEASPEGKEILTPQDGILAHANHFITRPEIDAFPDAPKNRDVRLRELLEAKRGEITAEYIMECMGDHVHHPLGVCSHPDPGGNEEEQHRSTVASLLMDLTDLVAYVCVEHPCENEYTKYIL